jgi:hypothetical protein
MTVAIEQPAMPNRHRAVRSVLTTVERVVFRGEGVEVARANAWAAVQEDRERARARAEAAEASAAESEAFLGQAVG